MHRYIKYPCVAVAGKYMVFMLLLLVGVLSLFCEDDQRYRDKCMEAFMFPEVEAAIEIPAIKRTTENVLLVYKYSVSGFSDAHNYDTLIFSFFGMPLGALTNVVVSERRMYEERAVERYVFARTGDDIKVISEKSGRFEEIGTLRPIANGVGLFSMDTLRMKYLLENGAVTLRSGTPGAFLSEEWETADEAACRKTLGTSVLAVGGYSAQENGRILYTERRLDDIEGIEAVDTAFRVDGDIVRISSGGVEPICDVFSDGLVSSLSNHFAVENFALIDIVLGRDCRLTPVLAWILAKNQGTVK